MGETEIILFLTVVTIIIFVFITGVVLFVYQYRKRRLLHQRETELLAEKHRIELLHAELEMQTQTMQFIGREIHDSVAQKLTLASIYIQKLEFENSVLNNGVADKLQHVNKILNDGLYELRSLSRNLTDSKLQTATLESLLKNECDQVNAIGVCAVSFSALATDAMSISVKSFLLRIAQEFLQNSLKHSACKNIIVSIEEDTEGLVLKMKDDGKGFDVEAVKTGGIGLNNMTRRIRLIGGHYHLFSNPDEGTRLELYVPFSQLNN